MAAFAIPFDSFKLQGRPFPGERWT
jgi:hypothetical protein